MLNPVVNYSPVVNPQNPSFDPFEEYTPPAPGAECRLVLIIESLVGYFVCFCSGPSVYPGSIQDILDSLDGQYPPSDQGLPKPYDPPPELHYPPATHPPTQKPTSPPKQPNPGVYRPHGPGTSPPPYVRLTTRTSIYTTQHYTRPRPQQETTTKRTPLKQETEATLRPSTEYGTKPVRNPLTARPPSQYGVGSPPPSRPEDYMAVIPYRFDQTFLHLTSGLGCFSCLNGNPWQFRGWECFSGERA